MRQDTKNLTRSERLGVYSKELGERKTLAEIAFEKILDEVGYRWEAQKIALNANAIIDYYIPYLKIGLEVDGDYHNHRKDKDAERSKRIRMLDGIKIIRFSNNDVFENSDKIKERLWNREKAIESNHKKETIHKLHPRVAKYIIRRLQRNHVLK